MGGGGGGVGSKGGKHYKHEITKSNISIHLTVVLVKVSAGTTLL